MNTLCTPHFRRDELTCPHCDRIKIVPGMFRHMDRLEEMRVEAGFPIVVNSGYRCPEHNKEVGGAPDSWHMLFATDVRPEDRDPDKVHRLYKIALVQGWGGIIRHDTFLHLDLRPTPYRARV